MDTTLSATSWAVGACHRTLVTPLLLVIFNNADSPQLFLLSCLHSRRHVGFSSSRCNRN